MKDLKPCPFCDGKAKLVMQKDTCGDYLITVKCDICGARIAGYYPQLNDEDGAIEDVLGCAEYAVRDWNRRAGIENGKSSE